MQMELPQEVKFEVITQTLEGCTIVYQKQKWFVIRPRNNVPDLDALKHRVEHFRHKLTGHTNLPFFQPQFWLNKEPALLLEACTSVESETRGLVVVGEALASLSVLERFSLDIIAIVAAYTGNCQVDARTILDVASSLVHTLADVHDTGFTTLGIERGSLLRCVSDHRVKLVI